MAGALTAVLYEMEEPLIDHRSASVAGCTA
jgi:hypothetical protein